MTRQHSAPPLPGGTVHRGDFFDRLIGTVLALALLVPAVCAFRWVLHSPKAQAIVTACAFSLVVVVILASVWRRA